MKPNRRREEPRADAPGLPARRAALTMLHGVLGLGRPLERQYGVLGGLQPSDRGLAQAIALAALRRVTALDAAIDSATPQPLPRDAKARMVLRLALAQAWALGTPPHAIVATALPLLAGGPRRLAHAVLSRVLSEHAEPPAARLPEPWASRWADRYGEAARDAIAAELEREPPLDLALCSPAETSVWAERLGGVSLAPGHVRLPADRAHGRGALEALPGFAVGAWWVQDLAASLPARLLGPGPGRVLDLCAAPGGKTLQLAAAGWEVTALDLSARRLELLAANLARTGLSATAVTADALAWEPPEPFDAVLIDAPCSATGIARRHPDVLYLKATPDLAPLVATQAALAARAAGWLRPGGTLVYAVCSLEPEEGEAQAGALSREPGLVPIPIAPDELPASLTPTAEGWLRTRPDQLPGGLDGFFGARFRRA
ncbi:MAG: RsmB/NOP family class I SAM-dependent RNA methyltransferase [Sphingomonadaceae bacterium]|nr:RsmB/NOP family class I SAM-dependent RNA methyltransferase [Sphingomonadaceae bacterium]